MQITFRLWKCQKTQPKNGWQIIADVTWSGLQQRLATGERCFAENWVGDSKKSKFVSTNQPYHFYINRNLTRIRDIIHKIFYEHELTSTLLLRRSELKEKFKAAYHLTKEGTQKETNHTKTIKEVQIPQPQVIETNPTFKDLVEIYVNKKEKNYARAFKQVVSHLIAYRPKAKAKDMGYDFLEGYVNYLFDTVDLESNTINFHIKKIKSVLNSFAKKGVKLDLSYQEFSHEYIEPDVVFLLAEEVEMLRNINLIDEDLQQARDFFLFGCYIGARYSDLVRLTIDNITDTEQGKILRYRAKKSQKKSISILLIKDALDILSRYEGKFGKKILPQLKNDELNEKIKEVAKRAKIDSQILVTKFKKKKFEEISYKKYEKLTAHCSRHTFATLCFMSGMDERVVQDFLGHIRPTMTKRYIHLANSYKSKQLEKVWAKSEST